MRTIPFLILLFLFVSAPVLGQSKKEIKASHILSKAIKIYKSNYPAFKGHSVHLHPFRDDSIVREYYSGYSNTKFYPIKYYASEEVKIRAGLDSLFIWRNKGEYLFLHHWQIKESTLNDYDPHEAIPPPYSEPIDILAYFYLIKRKLSQHDTVINGEKCYRFEYVKENTIDPITGLHVTKRKEILTLSWTDAPIEESVRIKEYMYYEEWDGDAYKFDYKFTYLNDSTWQKHVQDMDAEIALYFVDYRPAKVAKNEKSTLKVGDTIQYWHFKQLGGDSIDIRTLNRDYYVLDFWYTACGPCVGAIPNNNKLDSSIRQYNAQLLGITTFHKSDSFLMQFKEKRNIKYTLFTDPDHAMLEANFPILGYPTFLVINKDGKIIHIEYLTRFGHNHQVIEDKIKEQTAK